MSGCGLVGVGVSLLEWVWSCWSRSGLVGVVLVLLEKVCYRARALSSQKLKPGLVAHSLLPKDPDVEILAPLQHHVCLQALMLPALMIVD